MGPTVMITGANVGIGKEVARQLGLRAEVSEVCLACRNEVKAQTARVKGAALQFPPRCCRRSGAVLSSGRAGPAFPKKAPTP